MDEQTVTAALGVLGQGDGVRLAEALKAGDLAAAVAPADNDKVTEQCARC